MLDTYPLDFITVHSATSLEFTLGVRQISLLMLLDFIQHCSESSLEGKGVTTEQWGCIKSFGLLHGELEGTPVAAS